MDKSFEDTSSHLLSDCSDYEDDRSVQARDVASQTLLTFIGTNLRWIALFSLLSYIAAVLTAGYVRDMNREVQQCKETDDHFTLPKHVLEYEERPEWLGRQPPWNQEPSPALDDLWEDLLYGLNVRVTQEELDLLDTNTTNRIQLTGGDYIGVLGVFHHLHCLNNIRRIVHWDYYQTHTEWALNTGPFSQAHSDHCIDAIRQALMCHPNTEIHTGIWVDNPEVPFAKSLGSHAMTTCVKWDSLNDWAHERALVPGTFTFRPSPLEEDTS